MVTSKLAYGFFWDSPNTFLHQDSTHFFPVLWVSGNQRPETPTSLLCEGGWVCLWER